MSDSGHTNRHAGHQFRWPAVIRDWVFRRVGAGDYRIAMMDVCLCSTLPTVVNVVDGVRRWYARGRRDPERLLSNRLDISEDPLRRVFRIESDSQNRPKLTRTRSNLSDRPSAAVVRRRRAGGVA